MSVIEELKFGMYEAVKKAEMSNEKILKAQAANEKWQRYWDIRETYTRNG